MNELRAGRRRYQILGALGRGGFGTVYHAQLLGEEGFRKPVALKVLNKGLVDRPELAARLRDEARILGLIRHRAVVQVDDLVRLDGAWTVVMEYVGGVDLWTLIRSGPVPQRAALEIVQEVASALHVAWNTPGPNGGPLNLLHRDIKPGNLLLTAAGEVKVLDFGIAKADFGEREGQTRSVGFGSPEYMSPERLEWQNGPESDIYSLGCVLYELVTTKRFGISSGHPDRHQARIDEAAATVREQLGPGGEEVAALLRQLLAYEPKDRPTARGLERQCEGLVAVLSGERLRDWAEQVVPAVLEQKSTPDQDGSAGKVLVEGTGTDVPPDGTMEVGGGRTKLWLAVGVVAGIVLLLGVVVVTAIVAPMILERRDGGSAGGAPSVTAPVETPAPQASVPAPAADSPATPSEDPPALQPAPSNAGASQASNRGGSKAKGTKTPAPSPPEAAATASAGGSVSLTGDATAVKLVSGGASYPVPGEVPAGKYAIVATFPGREPATYGTVGVEAGQRVSLACSAAFKVCRPQ